jgi:NTE family protein
VAAALIAGNPDDKSIERLRAFWKFPPLESYRLQPWQHVLGWAGAVGTRLVGSHGHFHPRWPLIDPLVFRSLYDLRPMRERSRALVDFGRLNSGETRICVVATDI